MTLKVHLIYNDANGKHRHLWQGLQRTYGTLLESVRGPSVFFNPAWAECPGRESLWDFVHPELGNYYFGADDANTRMVADHYVYIPMPGEDRRHLHAALAAAIVLAHRHHQLREP